MLRFGGLVALAAVGCAPTVLQVDVTLADGAPAPTALLLSLYDPSPALASRHMITASSRLSV